MYAIMYDPPVLYPKGVGLVRIM